VRQREIVREKHMRKLASHIRRRRMGTSAQAGPWCAFFDSSTFNCGLRTGK
jgi:hypothetical protein